MWEPTGSRTTDRRTRKERRDEDVGAGLGRFGTLRQPIGLLPPERDGKGGALWWAAILDGSAWLWSPPRRRWPPFPHMPSFTATSTTIWPRGWPRPFARSGSATASLETLRSWRSSLQRAEAGRC